MWRKINCFNIAVMNSYKELTWFLQIQRIKLFLAVDDGWVVVKKISELLFMHYSVEKEAHYT